MADGEVVNEFSKVFDMVKLSLSISPSSSSSSNSTQAVSKIEETIVEDEVDLSLGLSLGGRFGIDRPTWSQAPPNNDGPFSGPSATFTDCQSPWPPEVQAEWKKRKDLESHKKSEAKRRKSDKQKKSENEVIQAIKRVPLQLACLEMHKGDGSLVSGLLHKCRKDEKRLKAKNNGHVLPWQLPLTSSVSS